MVAAAGADELEQAGVAAVEATADDTDRLRRRTNAVLPWPGWPAGGSVTAPPGAMRSHGS